MSEPCGVCGAAEWSPAYRGPIRDGVFGRERPGVVLSCGSCGVEFLSEPASADSAFYESPEYRESVGESADVQDYFARHDREQWGKYGLLSTLQIRDRVVADVGCGGGSFLDGLRGFAAKTIAIEPARAYHESLRGRGHEVYADLDAALARYAGAVDCVFSFSVIEHLDRPAEFVRGIRALVRPDGAALLSTPNRDDILMTVGSDAYRCFFYRVVHRYYFERRSLQRLAEAAGFARCVPIFQHRFGFANFVTWLAEGRPGGREGRTPLSASFDATWRAELERDGRADYLYAFLFP